MSSNTTPSSEKNKAPPTFVDFIFDTGTAIAAQVLNVTGRALKTCEGKIGAVATRATDLADELKPRS